MANKKAETLKRQKMAVGGVLVVIVGVLVYLFSVLATEVPLGEYEIGKHYTMIEQPRRIRGNKIEVMEFFSYGCVHCYNLDPNLAAWMDDHKHKVKLVRMPVVASPLWREYAKAYFAMETMGILEDRHTQLFAEIHSNGKQPATAEEFANLISIDADERAKFIETYNSGNTVKLLERADKLSRQFKIATVPNLVVQGKYLVKSNRNVGLSRMIEILNFLLDKEAAAELK